MDEPGFNGGSLSEMHTAVVGLGLMGGSLAMALRGKCAGLTGIDPDPAVTALAEEWNVADRVTCDLRQGLRGAKLIILAAPVRAILSLIDRLPELVTGPALLVDLGSTKAKIAAAMDRLPEQFEAVGGHPMCGKERSSLRHAEASLFEGAPFALTATGRTTDRARFAAEELARAVGSRPVWTHPDEHDRWVAATSHTPFLLSSALALSADESARPLTGPGFRSTARLAASSPEMMVDILSTNRENILAASAAAREQLLAFERLLAEENYEELSRLFAQGAEKYGRML